MGFTLGTVSYNCFHMAIIHGYSWELLSKMIKRMADVQATTANTGPDFNTLVDKTTLSSEILNMHGNTALHLAFIRKNDQERLDIIKKLLPYSFLQTQNMEGFTVFHFACILGDEKLIELLISAAKERKQFTLCMGKINIFGESAISIIESNKGNFSQEKVKRMLELFRSDEPQKNPEPNFAHQLTNLSSGNIAESGRAYAMKIMPPEEYEKYKFSSKEEKEEQTAKKPEACFTWFEGRFSTKHAHIKYIDPMERKTPNQYFYDNPKHCDYGKHNVLRFARNENQQGIKDYKSNDTYEITLIINEEIICQKEEKYPSGEDKLFSTKNRMLLFSFQSDDNKASLHIPVEEIDPHKNSSLKGIKSFHIALFDSVENNKHSDDNNNNVYSRANIS